MMKNYLKEIISDKKILILGYGREGRSTYALLEKIKGYQTLDISDANKQDVHIDDTHHLIFGENYLDVLNDYDVVFKSPGVVLPKSIEEYTCFITCQADLFMKVYGCQTVGITGTKGKSTTSSLLYHILKENGKDVLFGGNIGLPIFEVIDDIKPNTTIIFELSCHQLEYAHFSPKRAILLNLYEDHLDHYGTIEKYWEAKKNLYKNQLSVDKLYCNPEFLPEEGTCKSHIIPITIDMLPFKSWEEIPGATLRGSHNLLNTSFVYNVCKDFEISDADFKAALATFKTLAHRLEYLGKKDDVDYYDDSISTTVESAKNAINAIPNAGTILLGGMDRGIDYDPLVAFLPTTSLEHIILMYDSGLVLYDKLKEDEHVYFVIIDMHS